MAHLPPLRVATGREPEAPAHAERKVARSFGGCLHQLRHMLAQRRGRRWLARRDWCCRGRWLRLMAGRRWFYDRRLRPRRRVRDRDCLVNQWRLPRNEVVCRQHPPRDDDAADEGDLELRARRRSQALTRPVNSTSSLCIQPSPRVHGDFAALSCVHTLYSTQNLCPRPRAPSSLRPPPRVAPARGVLHSVRRPRVEHNVGLFTLSLIGCENAFTRSRAGGASAARVQADSAIIMER